MLSAKRKVYMMNGKHKRPASKKYTRIEKFHIAYDVFAFVLGCGMLLCINKNFYPGVNALLLIFGAALIYCACLMYYGEFMLPDIMARREREAKRRAARHKRQVEREVRQEWALYK